MDSDASPKFILHSHSGYCVPGFAHPECPINLVSITIVITPSESGRSVVATPRSEFEGKGFTISIDDGVGVDLTDVSEILQSFADGFQYNLEYLRGRVDSGYGVVRTSYGGAKISRE